MKKKILVLLITASLLLQSVTLFCHAEGELSLSAKSAVLLDADSGAVLYEQNARERMGMASTTKIMTALTVVRLTDTDRVVSIPAEAVGTEGSSVYLCAGEKLTVEQLLYALLLSSANDAAVALAIVCAGSVDAFAEHMNAYARELGLVDTNFVNPHGLYDDDHYTTAYDLALISREALRVDLLADVFATYKKQIPFDGEDGKRLLVNHNKLLNTYDGAIGMKTGFTKKTGRCLVSAARRDGLTLIAVTLSAPDDWRDHTAMLDYGFEVYERRVIADVGGFEYELPCSGGESETVTLYNTEPLAVTVKKGEGKAEYAVMSTQHFLIAPVKQGDRYATVTVTCGSQSVSSPLAVNKSVSAKKQKTL